MALNRSLEFTDWQIIEVTEESVYQIIRVKFALLFGHNGLLHHSQRYPGLRAKSVSSGKTRKVNATYVRCSACRYACVQTEPRYEICCRLNERREWHDITATCTATTGKNTLQIRLHFDSYTFACEIQKYAPLSPTFNLHQILFLSIKPPGNFITSLAFGPQ